MQNQMNAEDELKVLRLQREAKEAKYKRRRATAKPVFIALGVVSIMALVYAFVQKHDAEQLRMLAEIKAVEARDLRVNADQELRSCNSDLDKLKISLTECQAQTQKK